jgi:hypothetical protein
VGHAHYLLSRCIELVQAVPGVRPRVSFQISRSEESDGCCPRESREES